MEDCNEEIPKTIIRNKKKYTFVQQCNDKLFLYKDSLGIKTTFSRYDLGLVKALDIKCHNTSGPRGSRKQRGPLFNIKEVDENDYE